MWFKRLLKRIRYGPIKIGVPKDMREKIDKVAGRIRDIGSMIVIRIKW